MSCDRTECRLLLHAHGELNWWERWQVERHLRFCPGCREQHRRFGLEHRALASCLVTPPMSRVSDRVAMQLGIVRPAEGPRLVLPRRLPALLLMLVAILSASAAVAFVQWRQTGTSPLVFWQQRFTSLQPATSVPCETPPCVAPATEAVPGCTDPPPGAPVGPPEPILAAPGARAVPASRTKRTTPTPIPH